MEVFNVDPVGSMIDHAEVVSILRTHRPDLPDDKAPQSTPKVTSSVKKAAPTPSKQGKRSGLASDSAPMRPKKGKVGGSGDIITRRCSGCSQTFQSPSGGVISCGCVCLRCGAVVLIIKWRYSGKRETPTSGYSAGFLKCANSHCGITEESLKAWKVVAQLGPYKGPPV